MVIGDEHLQFCKSNTGHLKLLQKEQLKAESFVLST